MNEYGRFAEKSYRELTPTTYASIPDPKTYFSQLGEEAANQVHDLMRQIAGPDRPGESYLEKVGRLNMAKLQAEEVVRAELLTPAEEDWEEVEVESPMQWYHDFLAEKFREAEEYFDNPDQPEDRPVLY